MTQGFYRLPTAWDEPYDDNDQFRMAPPRFLRQPRYERTMKYHDVATTLGIGTYLSHNAPTVQELTAIAQVDPPTQQTRIGNEIELVSLEIRGKITPNPYNYNGGSLRQMVGAGYHLSVVWRPEATFGQTAIGDYYDDTDTLAYSIAPKNVENENKFTILRRDAGHISGSAFDVNTMYQTYNPAITGFMPYATCTSSNHDGMTKFFHIYIALHGRRTRYTSDSAGSALEGALAFILAGDEDESVLVHNAPHCVWHARLRFYDC